MAKILIVEDEPSIRKVVVEALKQEGFEVQGAMDAPQAEALLMDFKPDLILLDLVLPGKNGFEFLKEIKESEKTKKIPVIILSNLGDEEEIQQSLKLGAADFLIKADYDLGEVIEVIKKYLK